MGIFSDLFKQIDQGKEGFSTSLRGVTQNVDDFIRLGSSADTPENRTLVSHIADLFQKLDLESREISIHAPDISDPTKLVQLGRTVRGSDVVKRTAVAMVSPDAFTTSTGDIFPENAFGFQVGAAPGTSHHTRLVNFFQEQGIALENPDEVSSFVIMDAAQTAKRRGG